MGLLKKSKQWISVCLMGDDLFLVINRTGRDIKLTEWRKAYVEKLEQWTRYPCGNKTIKSGEHRPCSATEYEKRWRRIQEAVQTYPEWTVSLKSDDVEGIPLPIAEIGKNKAFVFEMGENDELVKSIVSRAEAESRGIKRGFFESLEKMESELISLVNERRPSSSSVRQDENM